MPRRTPPTATAAGAALSRERTLTQSPERRREISINAIQRRYPTRIGVLGGSLDTLRLTRLF